MSRRRNLGVLVMEAALARLGYAEGKNLILERIRVRTKIEEPRCLT